MHIALVNSFPNQVHTAEVEYIARFKRASERIGHSASEVVTSDQVYACDPDFVIATHFFTPKLTPHLTLGALWNPPQFFDFNQDFLHSILSYDGYLIGSEAIRAFASRLDADHGVTHPMSDFDFLPVSPSRALPSLRPPPTGLVYVGVQWDGPRHEGLFRRLDESLLLNVYGPKEGWTHCPHSYRGQVPFDGESLFDTLSWHGIALCFHKEQHRHADTPSARMFEAAAAGCLLITDTIPFAERLLGDTVFRVDLSQSAEKCAAEIIDRVAWARAHPKEASAMADASHAILASQYGLEQAIARCCEFVGSIRNEAAAARRSTGLVSGPDKRSPHVDILLPLRGRPLDAATAVLRSIAAQDHGVYRVLLVGSEGAGSVEGRHGEATATMTIEGFPAADLSAEDALKAGLAQVAAPFFTILDLADRIAPDHFGSLLELASRRPETDLFEASVVAIEEAGSSKPRPNFEGPLGLFIQERRVLRVAGAAQDKDNARSPACAWIARRHLRHAIANCKLPVSDLYRRLSDQTAKALTYRPTLHRAAIGSDETMERYATGRGAVDGEAEILALKRILFDVKRRAASAEHEAATLQLAAGRARDALEMMHQQLDVVESDLTSLGRSRVLRAIRWVSPKPLEAVRRLAVGFANIRGPLLSVFRPGELAPSDQANRVDKP